MVPTENKAFVGQPYHTTKAIHHHHHHHHHHYLYGILDRSRNLIFQLYYTFCYIIIYHLPFGCLMATIEILSSSQERSFTKHHVNHCASDTNLVPKVTGALVRRFSL